MTTPTPFYSVHAVGGQANFIMPAKNLAVFFKYVHEYKSYARPLGKHDRVRRLMDASHSEATLKVERTSNSRQNTRSLCGGLGQEEHEMKATTVPPQPRLLVAIVLLIAFAVALGSLVHSKTVQKLKRQATDKPAVESEAAGSGR